MLLLSLLAFYGTFVFLLLQILWYCLELHVWLITACVFSIIGMIMNSFNQKFLLPVKSIIYYSRSWAFLTRAYSVSMVSKIFVSVNFRSIFSHYVSYGKRKENLAEMRKIDSVFNSINC